MCIVFRIARKRKHNEVTLKAKYEAQKDLDKNRPNKEVAIQFNVPGSTLATWNQPILTMVCWRGRFWIFWKTCGGNYFRKWRIRLTNCTSLKKWSWRDNWNFEQIKSVHRGCKFWSFNLKTDPHYQSGKKR